MARLIVFIWRNSLRAPLRAALTAMAMAITLVAFITLRSVSEGWTRQVTETPNNRVVARHKIGWSQSLPLHYVDEVRGMPGIQEAMAGMWMDMKHPTVTEGWFETTAVQAASFIKMHYELVAPETQKQAFVEDRRGAFISQEMSKEWGVGVGDSLHLLGPPIGTWEFTVRGVYTSTRHGFGQRALWIHYEYFNEKQPLDEQNRIGLISAQIADPKQGAELARNIDLHFDAADDQTFTQEDQALNASFVGMFGALLEAIDWVSALLLGIIVLLLGNTVAMSVRERTQEYGVLRAIGFSPRHVTALILGESFLIGLVGAALGSALAVVVVDGFVGRFLKESMSLPSLEVQLSSALWALAIAVVLALLAAFIPSYRALKLSIVYCLRHVG